MVLFGNWDNIQYKFEVENLLRNQIQQRVKQAAGELLNEKPERISKLWNPCLTGYKFADDLYKQSSDDNLYCHCFLMPEAGT